MTRISVGVLCLVSLTASCSHNDAATTPRGTAFQGKDYVLKNVHKWEEKRNQMRTDRMWLSPLTESDDVFRENVSVTVEDIPLGMCMDECIQQSAKGLSAMRISVTRNYEPTKINGLDARVAHFNPTIGAVRLALDSYVVVVGNHAYVISCVATGDSYEEFQPRFREIVRTFSLLGDGT